MKVFLEVDSNKSNLLKYIFFTLEYILKVTFTLECQNRMVGSNVSQKEGLHFSLSGMGWVNMAQFGMGKV